MSIRSYHVSSGALTLREHETVEPGPGEVAVAVHAVPLSFRELLVLPGTYVLPVKPDVIPVSDGAGEVLATGPGVDGIRAGDRVTATLFPRWQDGPIQPEQLPQLGGTLDGLLTEVAILPATAIVPIPTHLSYAEAATLPCAAVTAWNALSGVQPGQTVLTTGSGGVSLFALQFAKLLGARVIATTGRPENADRLRDLGADEVIDYRQNPDWHTTVRGVDRVVDTAGVLDQAVKSLALSGQVALVGSVSGRWPLLDPRLLFGTVGTVRSVAVGSRTQFLEMNALITTTQLRPVIDRTFPFEEAAEAYHYYETARPFGKVIITVQPG